MCYTKMFEKSVRTKANKVMVLIVTFVIVLFCRLGTSQVTSDEKKTSSSVRISCTCKAESVIDLFPKQAEREKAILWFRKHGVSCIYLETFRHGRFADESLLKTVKADFEQAGFEVCGAICPTTSKIQPLTACSTKKDHHELLQKISERTASLFDRIILDDFIFTYCTCKFCTEAKGSRSWGDYRSALQLELGRKYILGPARTVNPQVQIYVKYPCWYENYYSAGYDVLRETEMYGHSWIGTETREPDDPAGGRLPQTQASWIQGWANDFSKGKCGGAWFDPLGTKPETFVEQARQSVLGGTREILIHGYDYLGTDTPGIAAHGTGKVEYGQADAEAFRREKDSLLRLAHLIDGMTTEGVLVAKCPNVDPPKDARLNGFIAMLGIPVLPAASLKETPADFFSVVSASLKGVNERIAANRASKRPMLLTINLIRTMSKERRTQLGLSPDWLESSRPKTFVEKVDNTLFVLGNDNDRWNLMDLSESDLQPVRDALMAPFGLRMQAPTRVSLHLFRSTERRIIAIENFNNQEVNVTLTSLKGTTKFTSLMAFPADDKISMKETTNGLAQITLSPRSLVILEEKTK